MATNLAQGHVANSDPFATQERLYKLKRRRVGLVIPPSDFLLDERVFVSLGILKVAAALEAAGHPVAVIDLAGVKNYEDAFAAYLRDTDVEVLGFTSTTPQLPAAFKLSAIARDVRPDLRRLLGGPHVTLTHSAVRLEERNGITSNGRARRSLDTLADAFDTLCTGDGEIAVLRAIQPDSPPIVDGDDKNGGFFMSDDFYDSTPTPSRHLVDLSSYHYSIEGHDATSLIAQLGCPFNCGFCGGRNSRSLRVTRTRTTGHIVDEIEQLHKEYGYTGFMFYDDELNVSPTLVELMNAISDLQERLGVSFRLRGFVKAELFTDEQAAAMYRAGFRWLLCGFEAAHPRILENIQKRATLDDNSRAVEIAKRHGLKVKALMSIGHPGESDETALTLTDWLTRMEVDDFDCTIITTYPGTPYYDLAKPHETMKDVWTYSAPRSGDRLHARDVDFSTTSDYYKGAPDGGYQAFVFTDHLTSEELVGLRDGIERDVRAALNIPFNPSRAAMQFEHSMGQGLPDWILRKNELEEG